MSHRSESLLGFSPRVFAARRERALSAIEGSALVLPAAELALKSADTERRYRADSELFYLTGMVEPGGLAVLRPGGENGDFVLFVQPRDAEAERAARATGTAAPTAWISRAATSTARTRTSTGRRWRRRAQRSLRARPRSACPRSTALTRALR